MTSRKYNIAMITDFFYPNFGGVENHVYQLSSFLTLRGHKVVIITHSYDNRKGVRYLTSGVKVYYVPILEMYNQSTFPDVSWKTLPILRCIAIRERIDIFHGHQAFSALALEGMWSALVMGYPSCFTDHSLFGFEDLSSIIMNKLLKLTLCGSHIICVSHTCKENTVLRAQIHPKNVSVIPNAVDCSGFTPDFTFRKPHTLSIIVISRLVYRKGLDLLAQIIPTICQTFPFIQFIIGGDGPKSVILEEIRSKFNLHDRLHLLGRLSSKSVRDTLIRGEIFLNCSLTEAFCIAIVEAASCGLHIVSTKVGGVPEVLPEEMVRLAEPNAEDMIRVLSETIEAVKDKNLEAGKGFHEKVRKMYSWERVAERTEKVYERLEKEKGKKEPTLERLKRIYGCGLWYGKIWTIFFVWLMFIWFLCEVFNPRSGIDEAVDFPNEKWVEQNKKWSQGKNKEQ
eukprot:TRINITY_DN8168_c0_g1_i1.p1 TRINITY_DN8168_c0_g1~~TRINITY_DN8168_c0_g1_i1.p1  ORF type:complete len:453 (-),score=62.54 TRINITY_DN8168_c0_g1_i1:373-1731(-)